MTIAAVTGFYDVGRGGYDNRTPEQYTTWLNQTLQAPLPFVIFLDPTFDASALRPKREDRIIRVAKHELAMFGHRSRIEEVVKGSEVVNRRDIAFNLVEYGMIVMSKPELLKRAARETDAGFLLWVDAGLCRFMPDLKGKTVSVKPSELEGMRIGLHTTWHLAQRMRIGKFPKKMIGKTLAMMSAGDLIVRRDFAEEFSDRLDFLVETEWLPAGLWDNEQVAIGSLLFRGGLPGARVLRTDVGGGGNTVRWLFGAPPYPSRTPLYVQWRLLLDEFRTRLAPAGECYLPGDFPEAEFNAWQEQKKLDGGVSR